MTEYAGVGLIAAIIGLSEICKKLGVSAKFIPIINLVFGLSAGIYLVSLDDLKIGIIQGIFIGLSASGLYSGVKNVKEGLQ